MIDYKELAERLRPYWETILLDNCHGGKPIGREYTAGDVNGSEGKSFKFNLDTGKWSDFAAGDKGGDIISYYAKVKGISNGEAKKELYEQYLQGKPVKHSYPIKIEKPLYKLIKPPPNAGEPGDIEKDGLRPARKWAYRDVDGHPLYYVFRYEYPDGSKQFWPMSFTDQGKWVPKMPSGLRTLYNLDKIVANPTKPVMVVEGEKTASAAEQLSGHAYTVTTWPGGCNGLNSADISPLKGRKLLLWPDADTDGIKAMDTLAAKLLLETEEIKVIRPDVNSGWDAADALAEGWDYKQFTTWAKRPGILELIAKPVKHVKAELLDAEGENNSQHIVGEISDVPVIMAKQLGLATRTVAKETYIIPNSANVKIMLTEHPKFKDLFWYDEFYNRNFTTCFGREQHVTDAVYLELFILFQQKYGIDTLAKSNLIDAVDAACAKNTKNQPRDWMNSLKWDGVPRVQSFFIRAMQAEDNEYVRAVSQNFFISQVARIFTPGCKFDNMVILEGGQGTFKSTSLDILGGKWFSEGESNLDNKDFEQALIGRMIVEFAELDQLRKAEDTLIKKKLSCRVDRYRPSYGRVTQDFPRTCIFVGTTNTDKYIKDTTGGRRYWPIKIELCDIDYIKANRDQFYAEAVELYKQGNTYHEVPESAKDEQENRRESHPWEEVIGDYLKKNPHVSQMRSIDVWTDVFIGDVTRLDQKILNQISKSMQGLKWKAKVIRTSETTTARFWVKPGYTGVELPKELDMQRPPIPNYALRKDINT